MSSSALGIALQILLLLGSALVVATIFFGLSFTIDRGHVRVRAYGWTVRKVAIEDIEFADRTWVWWNEHYTSTLNLRRIVRLRRRSGLFKNFVITPREPLAFLRELASHGVRIETNSSSAPEISG